MSEENIWRVVTLLIAGVPTLWIWYTTSYRPARDKEKQLNITSERERVNSIRAFTEATESRLQGQQSDQQVKLVDFLLASNDGKISAIMDEIKNLKVDVMLTIKDVDNRQGEQLRLVIASLNEVISAYGRFVNNSPGPASLAPDISRAAIVSPAAEEARAVTTAATPETHDPGPEVIAIVKAEPREGGEK